MIALTITGFTAGTGSADEVSVQAITCSSGTAWTADSSNSLNYAWARRKRRQPLYQSI
jgi:hypothetical protein